MEKEVITKYKKALWKLDHTICMNSNAGNLEFNIDKEEDYGGEGYDPNDTDCKDIKDAINCLEDLEEAVNLLEYLFKHAEYQTHPDPFFYEEMPERILIDVRKLVDTPALKNGPHNFDENNKIFEVAKKHFAEVTGRELGEDL